MNRYVGLGLIFLGTLVSTLAVQELRYSSVRTSAVQRPFIRSLSTPEELQDVLQKSESDPVPYCHANDYEKVELEAHQKLFANGKMETRQILGIKLTDLSSKLAILDLVLEDVQPEFIRGFAANCRDALCVVEKLTGSKEAALRTFNMKIRTSYTVNFAQESFQGPYAEVSIWTAKEIRDIETALQLLPRKFQNLKTLAYFRRSPVTDDFAAAYATTAYGHLNHGYILMLAKGLNSDSTIHTVVHEVGHHVDFSTDGLAADFQKLNANLTALFPVRERNGSQILLQAPRQPEDGYTSAYASTNLAEDFAESFSDYVVRSQHAYQAIPTKFDFMKEKVFERLDYRDYQIEKLKDFDSQQFSQLFSQCLSTVSHSSIRDEKFSMSFGLTTLLYSNSKDAPFVMNMYQGCLFNTSIPVTLAEEKTKICGNMGLHYQYRSAIQNWINDLIIEMASFLSTTVRDSAKAGISKKEMLQSIENKLMQMKTLRLFNEGHRTQVVHSLLSSLQESLTISDYKPVIPPKAGGLGKIKK